MNGVHVGTAPDNFEDWTSTKIYFHGFTDLPTTRGEKVTSPKFSCFGHRWNLELYPGGKATSDEEHVAIYLHNKSNSSIKIQFDFGVRDADGKEVLYKKLDNRVFGVTNGGYNAWGYKNFAPRSTILELLVQGSLIIEVQMKLPSIDRSITQFIPTNPIHKNVLELFMDEESADVVFEINNESCCQNEEEHTNKKLKTTTNFHAHRVILKNNAPTLYEMCGKSDGGGISTISITDVKPEIFKHVLHYAYGGKLSKEDLEANAKDIIDACDKYGVVHLKLEAEACYVRTEITMENMMDNLLYADSKNLALLKEAVMDYIVANRSSIIGKVSFSNVPGDMMTDLLTAVERGEATEDDITNSTDYNKMRVGTLRKLLAEKGLDVDGSREAMIALLKENDD